MNINTILFDLDGTLVNTNELIISSFKHTLDHYKPGTYGREDIIQFIGPPLTESFRKVDPERAEEMIEMYRQHNLSFHDELIEEYEGVQETVDTLHKEGFKLAVVTTKRKQTALMGIEVMGLSLIFPAL